jgi:hypothetical protein
MNRIDVKGPFFPQRKNEQAKSNGVDNSFPDLADPFLLAVVGFKLVLEISTPGVVGCMGVGGGIMSSD